MKVAGWIFIVIGALAFLGAASKGHSVFGPLFWIGIGGALLYLKKEKEENAKEQKDSMTPKHAEKIADKENQVVVEDKEQSVSITFEQKEAALCLIAFLLDIMMTSSRMMRLTWFLINQPSGLVLKTTKRL